MIRGRLLLGLALMTWGLTGCRCCFLVDAGGDVVDLLQDYPVIYDTCYSPRLDVSRAGKPDWCGPINRRLGCCRCAGVPEWTRHDDCWLYPPGYPSEFPGQSFPGRGPAVSPGLRDAAEDDELVLPQEPDLPRPLSPAPLPE